MRHINLILIILSSSLLADDPLLAEALAATGSTCAARGDIPHAKETLYRALANDINCAAALFELAKIADKEGDGWLAGELFTKCLGRLKDVSKQAHCESRLKALNPSAVKLNGLLNDYLKGLHSIATVYAKNQVVVDEVNARLVKFGKEKERIIFFPIGTWTPEKDHSVKKPTKLGDDHSISGGDGAGGTWELKGDILTLKYAKWHEPAAYTVVDADTLSNSNGDVFYRVKK